MSELISHTARLVPYARRPKHSSSFVTAYFYEPQIDEVGARLGNLYVVIEVLASGRASEEVVDLIIQTAGDKYYNNAGDEADPLARFEAAVKQTNHELSEYVERGNASWIGKLSAVIAIQAGSELHLSHTGSAEAFLYRGKAVSRITLTEAARPTTPVKTFGSITTGELEVGDRLLLATPALIHQIPLAKLQSVVSSIGPNAAIAELSGLLEGAETNRIAAIVVEITTPELAALKVRSETPAEIELGNGESFAQVTLSAATPLAKSTAQTSKQALRTAVGWWGKLRPRLQQAGWKVADALRRQLSTSKGRRTALIVLVIAVAVGGFMLWNNQRRLASATTFKHYQSLYSAYTDALNLADSGDKAAARTKLQSVNAELSKLGSNEKALDNQLKNSLLAQGEPSSVQGFRALVANQLDLLDGLVKVTPTTLTEIGGTSSKPSHFETDGSNAYVIDTSTRNAIAIVNLQTGVQKASTADTSKLGTVVATTLSSAGDGMYILTSRPSVWFYRFTGDTLTEQILAYDNWPKASAIASYATNLYLLDGTTVYKHVRSAGGYSPKTSYITSSSVGHPTTLAVDGWVYVLSDTGLHRFLGQTLKDSAALPSGASTAANLRSVAGGKYLISTSATRISLWKASDTSLTFDKQIALSEGKTLYDATYDAKLGKVFATVDHRLVSFTLKP